MSAEAAIEVVRELTAGVMADRVIVTVGVVHGADIAVAMMLTRKGGTCVVVGMAPMTELSVPFSLADLVGNHKNLKGALYGGMNPRASMPNLLSLYQSGSLLLDELVTRRYQLDEINKAFDDLRQSRNIRGIIEFPEA
jgi:Zn-dependent alcohol dehydrogenase